MSTVDGPILVQYCTTVYHTSAGSSDYDAHACSQAITAILVATV